MHKAAGRPWPILCPEDDVIDYMVMEAVAMRVNRAEADEEKRRKMDEFKKAGPDALRQYA